MYAIGPQKSFFTYGLYEVQPKMYEMLLCAASILNFCVHFGP